MSKLGDPINSEETVTTESAIMNSIGESFDDDAGSVDEGKENEQAAERTIDEQEETFDSLESIQQGKPPATNDGDSGKEPKQKASPGPQDLVDGQGNVIAKAGAERRHYENLQKERQRSNDLNTENQTLKAQVQAYEQVNSIGKELNITNEEVVSGAKIIAAYKADPIGTLNHLLTQAKASGYNIDELGGGGIDMAAVKQMIAEQLSPVTQKVVDEQRQSELQAQAEKEYNSFMGTYPDAKVHESTISRLLQEQPNLSLEAAYYKLQAFYHSRGFDWTKPLNVIEEEAAKKTDATNSATNVQAQNRPVPPSGGGVNNASLTDTSDPVGVDMSYEDIIRQSMGEAGIS